MFNQIPGLKTPACQLGIIVIVPPTDNKKKVRWREKSQHTQTPQHPQIHTTHIKKTPSNSENTFIDFATHTLQILTTQANKKTLQIPTTQANEITRCKCSQHRQEAERSPKMKTHAKLKTTTEMFVIFCYLCSVDSRIKSYNVQIYL